MGNKRKVLTQTALRRLLCYNPFTGNFLWRISTSNKIRVGDLCGCVQKDSKQRTRWSIKIHGHRYQAHHLAFLYMRGKWPYQVDHKDRNTLNNRWLNIRECTSSQNCANRGPNKDNQLGVKGVTYTKSGKYITSVYKNKKRVYKKRFNTIEAASLAYKRVAKRVHGRFAGW